MPKGKRLGIKTPEDFWKYVKIGTPTDCWEWQKGHNTYGHGMFHLSMQGVKYAHRYAYEVTTGELIPKGVHICHHCDNPKCCNPTHLFAGTRSDNMQDMIAKGRARNGGYKTGSAHHHAKLDDEQVFEIRRAYAAGENNQRDLADLFGVSPGTINQIVTCKTWKHVEVV